MRSLLSPELECESLFEEYASKGYLGQKIRDPWAPGMLLEHSSIYSPHILVKLENVDKKWTYYWPHVQSSYFEMIYSIFQTEVMNREATDICLVIDGIGIYGWEETLEGIDWEYRQTGLIRYPPLGTQWGKFLQPPLTNFPTRPLVLASKNTRTREEMLEKYRYHKIASPKH